MKHRLWPHAALSFALSGSLLSLAQAQPSATGRAVNGQFAPRVFINGEVLRSEAQPFTSGGRVLVPMRAIFERLNAQLRYNPDDQTVTARRRSTLVRLTLGSRQASVNNLTVTLDVPAASYHGRTFVPLRFVAEALGANVRYDFERQAVFIRERGEGFRGTSAGVDGDVGERADTPADTLPDDDRPAVHLPTHRVWRPKPYNPPVAPDQDDDTLNPDIDTPDRDIENPDLDDPQDTLPVTPQRDRDRDPQRDRYPRRNRPQPQPERYPDDGDTALSMK